VRQVYALAVESGGHKWIVRKRYREILPFYEEVRPNTGLTGQ
jgi:hypothetical protein